MSGKNYHHGDLKTALIKSARNILSTDGADALSLRAIAADVGVSHMAPYAHFKNKKELFEAIAAGGFRELSLTMVRNAEGVDDAREQILAYGATYIEFALANPQLYRLMLGQIENIGRRKQKTSEAALTRESDDLSTSSNRPFELLSNAFSLLNPNIDSDPNKVRARALGAWSMVHGMAALLIEGHFSIPEGMSIKSFLKLAAIN